MNRSFSTEKELQRLCEKYCKDRKITYIRIPNSVYQLIFSGSSKLPRWLKGYIAKYLKSLPDMTILYPFGKYKAIELKTDEGEQSPGQKKLQSKLGGNYYICRSYEQFQALLGDHP